MNIFVNNQLFFPNGQRMIDISIFRAGDILDNFIINNKITISDIPVVQLLSLLLEHNEVFEQFKSELKKLYIPGRNP